MSTVATATVPAPKAAPIPAPEALVSARRILVLGLAGVTAAVEVADISGVTPVVELGTVPLSFAIFPALLLAIACGHRLWGRSTSRRKAIGFWVAAGVLLAALAIAYANDGRLDLYPGLVAAALSEELIYRLAIPAVIAAALRLGNVRPTPARIAGLVGAALWFVVLPGHREQMTSPAGLIPFIAFAGLSALVVYRSGSVLPMAVAHAISNLLTVLMWREAVPADARGTGLACVLGLLVLAYGRQRRITLGDHGELIDVRTGYVVTGLDLRDGHEPTVTLSDGRNLPAHADMALPRHTVELVAGPALRWEIPEIDPVDLVEPPLPRREPGATRRDVAPASAFD